KDSDADNELLFQQIELAYSQFEATRVEATFVYEVTLTNLLAQFEQKRRLAEQTRDQIIAAAQVAFNPQLAETSAPYQAALDAANDQYWQSIDQLMQSFQSAAEDADETYQQAIEDAQTAYQTALEEAEQAFNLS